MVKLMQRQYSQTQRTLVSLPPTKPLGDRVSPGLIIKNYADWPYKIIYSSDGVDASTAINYLNSFYDSHPEIPIFRRPNLIHVAGKYVIGRISSDAKVKSQAENDLVIRS